MPKTISNTKSPNRSKTISIWVVIVAAIVALFLLVNRGGFSSTSKTGSGEFTLLDEANGLNPETLSHDWEYITQSRAAHFMAGFSHPDAYQTVNRSAPVPQHTFQMSNGHTLFYSEMPNHDWYEPYSVLKPEGSLGNTGCMSARIYSFDPQTKKFTNYDKVNISNPISAQPSLLPDGRLLVVGREVPVGGSHLGLPPSTWAQYSDESQSYLKVMIYDLKSGDSEEIKVDTKKTSGISRIPVSPRSGYNQKAPLLLQVPGKGILILNHRWDSTEREERQLAYFYNFRTKSLNLYEKDIGLPVDSTQTLKLSNGKTLIFHDQRTFYLFNPKTMRAEQIMALQRSHPAHPLINDDLYTFTEVAPNQVFMTSQYRNERDEWLTSNSYLHVYDLDKNKLYTRQIGELPLQQYALPTRTPDTELKEIEPEENKYQVWPISQGVVLIAGYSYRDLPFSYGLFSINDMSEITSEDRRNKQDILDYFAFREIETLVREKDEETGEWEQIAVNSRIINQEYDNIALPTSLQNGSVLFTSGDPKLPTYTIYSPDYGKIPNIRFTTNDDWLIQDGVTSNHADSISMWLWLALLHLSQIVLGGMYVIYRKKINEK